MEVAYKDPAEFTGGIPFECKFYFMPFPAVKFIPPVFHKFDCSRSFAGKIVAYHIKLHSSGAGNFCRKSEFQFLSGTVKTVEDTAVKEFYISVLCVRDTRDPFQ